MDMQRKLIRIITLVLILLGSNLTGLAVKAQSPVTEIVSISSRGTQANAAAGLPSITANGRYVTFISTASNLVRNDTNGTRDCFVHDRLTGETSRISVASDGTQGNGDVNDECLIAANGRYVSFGSSSTNLVTEFVYAWSNAYLHDLHTGSTTLIARGYNGGPADWPTSPGPMSTDGRYLTIWSPASNILPGNPNRFAQVYVYDQTRGQLSRVSLSSTGEAANGSSYGLCISGNGRYVSFGSYATNLVTTDTNGLYEAFVYDRDTGRTERISRGLNGTAINDTSLVSIQCSSENGRFIAFDSGANNLVPNDTNERRDAFVYNQGTEGISRVSVATNGTQANGQRWLFNPTISLDGRYVAFESWADNLVPGDTNLVMDIFVHDRETHKTTRVSVDSLGNQANQDSFYTVVAGNGDTVVFTSAANNLTPGDTNQVNDIFVYERHVHPNLLQNPGFEFDTANWQWLSSGKGSLTAVHPGYAGDYAARLALVTATNAQVRSASFTLEPKTIYQLTFAARSQSGRDLTMSIENPLAPNTNYGLRNFRVNLSEQWRKFSVRIQSKNLTAATQDTPLRLLIKPLGVTNDSYWLDSITLAKGAATMPTVEQEILPAAVDAGQIAGIIQQPGDVTTTYVKLLDLETDGMVYNLVTQTDSSGAYAFAAVPYGTYELQVLSPAGYLPVAPLQLAVSEQENESINFTLEAMTSTIYLPLITQ